jgi:formate dehydrogenase assembly factor FdhD
VLTYGNYYVDSSGSPNSIVLTINSPTTFSYQAGVPLQVKIANTNTGPTQINVNGLGAKNVTTTSLSTLAAGQLVANAVVTMIYDGTQFQVQNPSIAAVGAAAPTPSSVQQQRSLCRLNACFHCGHGTVRILNPGLRNRSYRQRVSQFRCCVIHRRWTDQHPGPEQHI